MKLEIDNADKCILSGMIESHILFIERELGVQGEATKDIHARLTRMRDDLNKMVV